MQQLKAGPYGQEQKMQTLQEQRQKRIERRKQRLEERREEVKRSLPGGKISLGRRNTYFLIAVVALLVLLIVVFIVLRYFHIIG
jgi:Flp pilus assembly protein TadB